MAEVSHPGIMNNAGKIIEFLDRHAISEGVTETPIEGLQLFGRATVWSDCLGCTTRVFA